MIDNGVKTTYELGERFPSGVDLCCAVPSPITTGVLPLADTAVDVAELRSVEVWVEGASVGKVDLGLASRAVDSCVKGAGATEATAVDMSREADYC